MSVGGINSSISNFGKGSVNAQSAKGLKNIGLMQSMKKKAEETGETKEAQKAQSTQDTLSVQKNEAAPQLSEKALVYLETLKEKFGDVNFIVSDGTASSNAGTNGKKYNCFISADLLEKMAADETYAAKYEGVIADAITQVDDLKAQVEAKGLGHLVKGFSITIDEKGETIFTAMLKGSERAQQNKKGASERENSVSSSSIDGILEHLEKLKEQRLSNTKKPESKDEAEKPAEAPEVGVEAVKRAYTSATKGRRDGIDINSMLPKNERNSSAPARENKNRDVFKTVDD